MEVCPRSTVNARWFSIDFEILLRIGYEYFWSLVIVLRGVVNLGSHFLLHLRLHMSCVSMRTLSVQIEMGLIAARIGSFVKRFAEAMIGFTFLMV